MGNYLVSLLFVTGLFMQTAHAQSTCYGLNCGMDDDITTAYTLLGRTEVMLAEMQLQRMNAVFEDEEDQRACIRACEQQFTGRMNDCSSAVSITTDEETAAKFLDTCYSVALSRLKTCLEPVGYMNCMPE